MEKPAENEAEISTHAPLARCDEKGIDYYADNKFQLTHLLRGATLADAVAEEVDPISTHAPLARCDRRERRGKPDHPNFNSRTSCEVRRVAAMGRSPKTPDFNSRTSCEVRPPGRHAQNHAADFNSRTSCEVRPGWTKFPSELIDFNSRTSCEVRHLQFWRGWIYR